jgi:succinylarginine dihydrolase
VLTEEEKASFTRYTTDKPTEIYNRADRFYRDRIEPRDLADPDLAEESKTALDALTQLLDLGSLYSFQKE